MVYIWVGVAGFLGAVLRYVTGVALFNADQVFPYATLLVNVSGSFLLAWFTMVFVRKIRFPAHIQAAISTGFLGSFTTFSTVSVETVQLFNDGEFFLVGIYIGASLFGGLWMSQLGFRLGKKVSSS